MLCQLMGVQRVDFEADGKHIVGSKLHVVSEDEERTERMVGKTCSAVFTQLPVERLQVGGLIDLVYEMRLGSAKARLVRIDPVEG